MKQTGLGKAIRSPLPFLLTMAFAALICVHLRAQTCTVTANGVATDSFFNAEYTENGPGTRNEPAGRPGWTGADSTYSVLLPSGDTAFFFSDSYVGVYPTLSGDGTVRQLVVWGLTPHKIHSLVSYSSVAAI